ncbi:flagellar operon protein [Caldicellulosiruptor saccharolyticus DSM 8903]|uniref:Flagellar operon protein n=1 Tax=Caldicellulosiruptor saccharolyticus (strain ATCC 43494 / DSM 8903 / Tp8T 6331) TaxID=351627 RepID=A4XIY3_CALS8|nr:TIGR02530 family flagellar biosynthesis protein [Caldicellulosiruptor saccharolyticus]ABP66868.1 flagellar operon protein [Caldicellulosiruptor saccharolyticus DSM 8903]
MTINRIGNINSNRLNNTKIERKENAQGFTDLLSQSLKISKHANERLQTQNINIDSSTLTKLEEAIKKAEQKGLKNDVLVLNGDIAYIVNIKNRVVVTVKDVNSLKDNIFTNIDGVLMI